jgi:hypothetical protein
MPKTTYAIYRLRDGVSVKEQFPLVKLTPAQGRLIKSLMVAVERLATAKSEQEFFENSALAFELCANLVQQAAFVQQHQGPEQIPYAQQAVEYALDLVAEKIGRPPRYDN